MKRAEWVGIVVGLSMVAANEAAAVDGVKLLGTTSFPIVIDQPGSYRLKRNLLLPGPGTTAIQVTAPDVTIDLNGFSILGSNVCEEDQPVTCNIVGAGIGIQYTAASGRITVRNGSIVGMGSYGIFTNGPGAALIEGIHVRYNGGDGINVGRGSIVHGCTVEYNGQDGVAVVDGATVDGNVIHYNGGIGIFTSGDTGSRVTNNITRYNDDAGITASTGTFINGNVSERNGSHGIFAEEYSIVSNNVASANQEDGIHANGCTITGNTALQNNASGIVGTGIVTGNTVGGSPVDGIYCSGTCTLTGNTANGNNGDGIRTDPASAGIATGNVATFNDGYGMNLGSKIGYAGNSLDANGGGTVTGGVQTGTNLCNGSVTYP
jgi:parallel beta-helix repeat protein